MTTPAKVAMKLFRVCLRKTIQRQYVLSKNHNEVRSISPGLFSCIIRLTNIRNVPLNKVLRVNGFVLLFYFTIQSVNQIQDKDTQMLSSPGKRNALRYIHETSRGAFLGQSDICDCIQRCQARVQYLTKLCH